MSYTDLSVSRVRSVLPLIDSRLVVTLLLAGLASTVVWEIWARVITPEIIGGKLSPAGLVKSVFGTSSIFLAEAIHFFTGIVAYPLGYLLVARPAKQMFLPAMPWWLLGLVYGLVLFVFALYVMAHLVAGFPAFLGWGGLAQVSLAGHLLFALVIAAVVQLRERSPG